MALSPERLRASMSVGSADTIAFTRSNSPAREGAHGSSWTQTTYRVGDADITNLNGSGTPLLMPGVDVWERVDVTTGMMPIDVNAPAMAVTLLPRRPSASQMRSIELFGS